MKYNSGRYDLPATGGAQYNTPILALIKKPSKSFQSLIMKLLAVNADFPPTRVKKEDLEINKIPKIFKASGVAILL